MKTALETLGYRVTGPNGVQDPSISKNILSLADSIVPYYDAFQDNPWPLLYRYIDQKYLEALFILTLRDPDDWLKSVLRYFGNKSTPMREMIYGYGSPIGHESEYIDRYNKHNEEVMYYFRNRSDKLLVINIFEGDGWNELCPFLNKPVPNIPFPHENRTVKPYNIPIMQEVKRSGI